MIRKPCVFAVCADAHFKERIEDRKLFFFSKRWMQRAFANKEAPCYFEVESYLHKGTAVYSNINIFFQLEGSKADRGLEIKLQIHMRNIAQLKFFSRPILCLLILSPYRCRICVSLFCFLYQADCLETSRYSGYFSEEFQKFVLTGLVRKINKIRKSFRKQT